MIKAGNNERKKRNTHTVLYIIYLFFFNSQPKVYCAKKRRKKFVVLSPLFRQSPITNSIKTWSVVAVVKAVSHRPTTTTCRVEKCSWKLSTFAWSVTAKKLQPVHSSIFTSQQVSVLQNIFATKHSYKKHGCFRLSHVFVYLAKQPSFLENCDDVFAKNKILFFCEDKLEKVPAPKTIFRISKTSRTFKTNLKWKFAVNSASGTFWYFSCCCCCCCCFLFLSLPLLLLLLVLLLLFWKLLCCFYLNHCCS